MPFNEPPVQLSDSVGNVVTSLKVTAGGPASGQAVKNYTGLITLSASTQAIAIETVAAGKTYFITDIIATTNDSASGSILINISAAGTAIFQSHINSTKGIEAIGIETQPQATSGQAVALNVPAATVGKIIAWNILGYEM